jgi:hypothetical protein
MISQEIMKIDFINHIVIIIYIFDLTRIITFETKVGKIKTPFYDQQFPEQLQALFLLSLICLSDYSLYVPC